MKSRLFRNALLLLLATAGLVPGAYAQEKGLLYEVSGNGLTQPSYLYGTFHIVCLSDLRLNSATSKAMADAKRLYLEIDLTDPTLPEKIQKSMTFSDGRTLKDAMKPDDYAALDAYLRGTSSIGAAQVALFKPIALVSIVMPGILHCETDSFEKLFVDAARQSNKEILGLESVEEQVAAIDKIPVEDQVRDLIAMVRQPEKTRKEITGLMEAYKAQDLTGLMKLMHDSEFDSDSKFEDDLLNKRNANWLPVIEKAARIKGTFFAFGAAHLVGAKGVVSLLREKGYTVKPIL